MASRGRLFVEAAHLTIALEVFNPNSQEKAVNGNKRVDSVKVESYS